jgi:ribose/xylose/arabinose/galactoside ABC-type transport system permease subunit
MLSPAASFAVAASVVLCGVSLTGGEGRRVNAMIGVSILGMTGMSLPRKDVHTTPQLAATVPLMLSAVCYQRLRKLVVLRTGEWA